MLSHKCSSSLIPAQDHNWNIYKATLLSDIVVNVHEQHHCAAQEHVPVPFHISLLPDKAFLYVSKTLALTVRHTRTRTKTHTQRAFQRTSPLRWLENLTEMKPSPVTSYISLLLKGSRKLFLSTGSFSVPLPLSPFQIL